MYKITISGETYYACGECGLIYRSRETARECESWCSRHKTCNVEIARHAVGSLAPASLRLTSA